jgi:hypothetical protein
MSTLEQNSSRGSKILQKPDAPKTKTPARPQTQMIKLLRYKGVLDKLAYES